jgi:acetolactate synthase-1/2/3 large subunit
VRCLAAEKVEYVFGYPGGAVLNIYDEVLQAGQVQARACAPRAGRVHAADGYSRSSQKIGVALVTSGPAYQRRDRHRDRVHGLDADGDHHRAGADPRDRPGRIPGVRHRRDHRPCVKHNFLVKDVRELAFTIKKAFHIAQTGRPGPVLVDIPKDVTQASCEFNYPGARRIALVQPGDARPFGTDQESGPVAARCEAAMIYSGGGVILNNAAPQLTKLVRLLGFPVTNTLMGLGGYPGTDPQFVGMLGMHGTFEANMAMQNCDVLLAVGARFDDRVIGNPSHFFRDGRKIIHIDIDPSSISKRVKVDVPIVGYVPTCSTRCCGCWKRARTGPTPRR